MDCTETYNKKRRRKTQEGSLRTYTSAQRIRTEAEGESRVSRFFFCPLPSAHESDGSPLELSDRSDKHPDAGRRTESRIHGEENERNRKQTYEEQWKRGRDAAIFFPLNFSRPRVTFNIDDDSIPRARLHKEENRWTSRTK